MPTTRKIFQLIVEAGADLLFVQSTVTTTRHVSKSYEGLVFSKLVKSVPIPVIVGNCVSYSACLDLMKEGVSGVLVGVGPGAACTSRRCSRRRCAANHRHHRLCRGPGYLYERYGRYVPIITDGVSRKAAMFVKRSLPARTASCSALLCPGYRVSRPRLSLGMSTPNPVLPGYPHQSRHQCSAAADSLWSDLCHQRHPEFCRRYQDRDGLLRRFHHPRNAQRRNGYRTVYHHGRQVLAIVRF